MVRAALANGRQTFSVTAVAYIEQFPDGILTHLGPCALCQLRLANSTVINSQRSTGGDPFSHLPGKTSGCGWALDLADVFANEYGWSHAAIWDEIPLVALFAYYAAIKARYETKASGPSYAEQDLIAARRTAAADSQPLTLDTPPPQ